MSTSIDLPAPLPRPQELANSLTHALGFMLSVVGTVVLLRATTEYGDAWQVTGVAIYGVTLMAVYAASTLSHSFERPEIRHFFRTVDQVCIFLLIAGTFTPISLTYLRGGWWWALFAAVWGLALLGIIFKIFFARLQTVTVTFYVLLGWLPVLAYKPIIAAVPRPALLWLAAGGVLYTLGTFFLVRDERVPYFHAVWHLLVIAASACHFIAVMKFVVPWPA